MEVITVILADDHLIFRKGMITVLNEIPFVKVIGEASNGNDVLRLVKKNKPDIIFMDIKMPQLDGICATKKIKDNYDDIYIIALTMHEEIGYFNQMTEAGADGFLLKKTTKDEIEEAINTVINGECYYSKEFVEGLKINLPKRKKSKIELTEREKQILDLICKGYSNQEMAKKLFISPKTVEGHRTRLLEKTGAKNSANLVMFALKNNLI